MIGLSLKAGGAGTKEPKFNTYVSAVMNDGFGDSETYASWQQESYNKYYKQVQWTYLILVSMVKIKWLMQLLN